MDSAYPSVETVPSLRKVAEAYDLAKNVRGDVHTPFSIAVKHGADVVGVMQLSSYAQVAAITRSMRGLGYASQVPASKRETDFDLVFDRLDDDARAARQVTDEHAAATVDAVYRTIVCQLPHGAAFVVSTELRYLLADGQSLQDSGMSSDMLEGKLIREVVPQDLAQQIERDYAIALAGGTFRREHAVGARFFSTHGTPLRDDRGEVYAALAVSYDITDLKAAENDLRQREEQARAGEEQVRGINRRKDLFLATLAHELRNPLAPLSMGISLLQRQVLDGPRIARTLTMLEKQVSQITRLVNDLLDLAKVAEGKLLVELERTTAQSLVEFAVESSRPMIASNGHSLIVDVPTEPLHLNADPGRVAQMISNLLNNASKFTPSGGKIELTVLQEGTFVTFRVKDNGPGIPAEQLASVFDAFAQLGTEVNQRQESGLGIGLTLVKSLAEMHGGSVTAFSEGPGKGATFTVALPVAPKG